MAPGSGVYHDVLESRAVSTDYGIVPTEMEFRSSPFRKCGAAVSGKRGMASNSAVHELLECPVCLNVMYPPIHQVYSCVFETGNLKMLDILYHRENFVQPFY